MFAGSLLPVNLVALPPLARQAFLDLQAQVCAKNVRVSQLTELTAAQEAQLGELKQLTERQEYLIAEMRHALFGKKSEKLDADERQLLFEDLEAAVAELDAAIDQQSRQDAKPRTKAPRRNRGHLPAHLPRIEQVIEPENKVCTCGCTRLVAIGEDRSERLDVIPAQFRVMIPGPRHRSTPLRLHPM